MEDVDNVLAYLSLQEIAQHQYHDFMTREQVVDLIETDIDIEPGMEGAPVTLAVEWQGTVIGDISVTNSVPEHEQGDIGIAFNPDFSGCGLATKALILVLGYCFEQLTFHKLTAATFADNERGWKLLERAGMRREGHFVHDGFVRGEWRDSYAYGMLDTEWRQRYPDLIKAVSR